MRQLIFIICFLMLATAQQLNPKDLTKLSADELEFKRLEIAARRGKIFKSTRVQAYFAGQSWYKPNSKYTDKLLSVEDKSNIKILYRLEEEQRRQGLKDEPHNQPLPQ